MNTTDRITASGQVTGAGAVALIVVWVLSLWKIAVPPEILTAMIVVFTWVSHLFAAWWASRNKPVSKT